MSRRPDTTRDTHQAASQASSIAFGEPYYVLERGWFADCLSCGSDIEHSDTCRRVLTIAAVGHGPVPTPDWVHEDCCDDDHTMQAEAGQSTAVSHMATGGGSRPQPYVLRSLEVSAMAWDGTEHQARAIVEWVEASGSGSARFGAEGIFLEQWPTPPLWVEPSMMLVRQGSTGWSVSTQERFADEFRPVLPELPNRNRDEVA